MPASPQVRFDGNPETCGGTNSCSDRPQRSDPMRTHRLGRRKDAPRLLPAACRLSFGNQTGGKTDKQCRKHCRDLPGIHHE